MLKSANLTEKWLLEQLNTQGVTNVQDVFFAMLNTQGDLYLSKYEDPPNIQKIDH
jgi:uncharacterized membrane protein YcaP (DUF421 family)